MKGAEQRSDTELLLAARTSSEPFGVFYERHVASVLAFFRRRVPGPEEAFDLTAETFAAALASVPRFEPGPEPPQAWLFAIARHKLSEALRRSRIQDGARRALAMQPIQLDDEAIEILEATARAAAVDLLETLGSRAARCDQGPPPRGPRLRRDRGRAPLLGERHPQAREPWPGCTACRTSKWRSLMSDPVSDLKRELLAAAERQQRHAVPARKSHRRWLEHSDVRQGGRRRRVVASARRCSSWPWELPLRSAASASFFLDRGFIGLPPVGATPSAPESGERVVHWEGTSATLPPGRERGPRVRVWVYADGRIIWDREGRPAAKPIPEGANEFTSGYLEQRLTPEGVELLRSEVIGLFDRSRTLLETVPADDDPRPGPVGGLALFVRFGQGSDEVRGSVEVLDGDRLVRLQWQGIGNDPGEDAWVREHFEGTIATPEQLSALRRVDALLTDPASVLPASAWAVREVRAYVPSHYAVCINTSPPKDPSQLLSLLPARAADVLRDKSRTRFDGEMEGTREPDGPIVVLGRWVAYCSKLTTEEAREVAEALSGLDREPGFGSNALAYRVDEAVNGQPEGWNDTDIWFEPYFPDGRSIHPPGG